MRSVCAAWQAALAAISIARRALEMLILGIENWLVGHVSFATHLIFKIHLVGFFLSFPMAVSELKSVVANLFENAF